jgi:hypothetical protein
LLEVRVGAAALGFDAPGVGGRRVASSLSSTADEGSWVLSESAYGSLESPRMGATGGWNSVKAPWPKAGGMGFLRLVRECIFGLSSRSKSISSLTSPSREEVESSELRSWRTSVAVAVCVAVGSTSAVSS